MRLEALLKEKEMVLPSILSLYAISMVSEVSGSIGEEILGA